MMTRILLTVLLCVLASPAWAGMHLGDYATSSSVVCMYNTNGADGASITRSTDGTLKIFKGSSSTERSSLTGITQTEDFDSATGVHMIVIDTSDNTDPGFFAAGNHYHVVNTGMVIDTKTVNAHLCSFTLEMPNGAIALLKARTPNAAAGASGGLLISGANSGTTTLGALTITGNTLLSDGLTVAAPSTLNRAGITVTGNGTGAGITATGGATGNGIVGTGGGTSGHGIAGVGVGSGNAGLAASSNTSGGVGMSMIGTGTGAGISVAAGATGVGVSVTTTAGDGISVTPTAGNALVLTGNGTSKHGMKVTGGTAGVSNGALFTAGSGGKDLVAATGITVDACTGCSSSGGTTLMPDASYVKASTNVIHEIFIRDSSTLLGKTGLTFATANLVIGWGRADQGDNAFTTCTAATATLGSYTSCGFKEKDATNAAGVYELGLTTAMLATGADEVTVQVYGASGTTPTILKIALVDVGLAAIYTRQGTPSGASMSADTAAIQTSATAIKAKTDSLNFSGSNVLTEVGAYSSGKTPLYATVEGRTLDVTSTGAAGIDWANIENPTTAVALTGSTISTAQTIAGATTVTNLTNAPTAGDLTATMKTSVTTAATSATPTAAAVTGAVGSVTGATGSVTNTVKTGGAIRKNVASQAFPIYMVLTSDHITAATGKTLAIQVSKDGVAFGNIAGSVAEIGNGWYLVSFAQADTNCDACAYRATAASTDTRNWYIVTGP